MHGRRAETARRGALLVAIAATAALLAGCAGGASGSPADPADAPGTATSPGTAAPDTSTLDGSVTVFAAASLKGTFTELATRFEAEHPGVDVELNFAGSSDLVTQITEGAPADVFASADEKNMTTLTDAGLIDPAAPVDFATNVLEIAVPPGNPAGITSFADLANPAAKVVVCAPQVPCGAATASVEQTTGVDIPAVSEESSVTDVLGKVTSGEADAGLVYVTDIAAAGDAVQGIAFPESANAVNTYPVAVVDHAGRLDGATAVARAFVDFVAGASGRAVLSPAGFGAP
ncbi:molybdate ABC transporter substrate-binding protein [Herbiconiux solani]|uniref:molybdate ABC transporter substrate-binding protein n=1 Tax=Herbiconiux solani TaxID=661329 RepID=UPI000824F834|nr:molybdate ABC transporter substrate-binding protein [Herbiconiux solani]